jgi:hypothetical protein
MLLTEAPTDDHAGQTRPVCPVAGRRPTCSRDRLPHDHGDTTDPRLRLACPRPERPPLRRRLGLLARDKPLGPTNGDGRTPGDLTDGHRGVGTSKTP